LDPNEPLAHFDLGNVYLKRGNATAAIPEYERAASLDPSLARAHFYLADAYARTGALRRALDEVRRGLEFEPGERRSAGGGGQARASSRGHRWREVSSPRVAGSPNIEASRW
jgi:tetratricopeptide (TPR) repeat protein